MFETLRKSVTARPAALAVILALGGAGIVAPAFFGGAPEIASPAIAQTQAPQAATPFSFADVVEKVAPAVVSVVVRSREADTNMTQIPDFRDLPEDHPFRRFFREFEERFGEQGQRRSPNRRFSSAQGSGFFISADGYLVTNNHVISKASEVSIRLSDGTEHDATVVGTDPKTDLALLKVDADEDFPFVRFASGDVRVGDWVIAVGNPFGLGGSVTAGIVSARGRDIGAGPYDDFLQIDAPVNRGNSGGPAFNLNGEVVGVNTAIFSPSGGNVGIAFAIPAATTQAIIADLRDKGEVTRGWLGVQIQSVTDEIAETVGLREGKGAIIARILDTGPAASSDLRIGDVITHVDGTRIEGSRELVRAIGGLDPDHTAELTIWREGGEQVVEITLGTQPGDEQIAAAQSESEKPASDALEESLGLVVEPSRDGSGVVITDIDPDGSAAERGLSQGDVILQIDGEAVDEAADVRAVVSAAREEGRTSVLALVQSEQGQRFVPLNVKG